MIKLKFNDDWSFYKIGEEKNSQKITIPHDAMLSEERIPSSAGGSHIGWFEGNDYVYEKSFILENHLNQIIIFEFEGIYHNAEVYINDEIVATHHYGYTNFYVQPDNLLFNSKNIMKVIVKNSDQPNSRWYSGTGIYRNVNMYIVPEKHILMNGIKIKTINYNEPEIQITVHTNSGGQVVATIIDYESELCSGKAISEGKVELTIKLPGAKLWSPKQPYLYTCRVCYEEDYQDISFGIRMIDCDSKSGFCINGERIILRGGCIHHDNGLLGACAYDFAEERKVLLMKESGYNAIRSAHNPCSKALLDACDKYGILVLDEYVDMWYIHKTKYDYSPYVINNYKEDLKSMIDKDYNHASVIGYALGNEVSETAQKRGIDLCEEMVGYCHFLDTTRPVTVGVNIFFNYLSSLGFGVYSDEKAEKEPKKAVGSAFFNSLAGIFGSKFMKMGATLGGSDRKTREVFSKMDIAGYNYGVLRYKKDLKKYPERVILGSETFCSDAYTFWELAKKNKALIGDFVWSAIDYLGEVGLGAWEYKNYAPDFSHGVGWLTSGAGRIDITGKSFGEMAYTRVAFELDKIRMAVIPVDFAYEKHSPSAWKMTNAIESWSFNGCDGKKTKVEVYARGNRIDLFINGKKEGTKKPRNDCRVVFKVKYYSGEIKAVSYDEMGKILAETRLSTAGNKTRLTLIPENTGGELIYVRLQYTDAVGIVKPLVHGEIKVKVEGGKLLGLGNGCAYNARGYLADTTDTYYGEALAIIQPLMESVRLYAESPFGKEEISLR